MKHELHGQRGTKEYRAWVRIKARCYNLNDAKYCGDSGISMCEEWRSSFKRFLADMGSAPPGTAITRRDVNGNFEPSNCLWGAPEPQRAERHHHFKHGLSHTKEYKAWSHAKDRCYSPRVHNYNKYGGRGITMCDEWRHSFVSFLRDMGPCPTELTLERKNVHGNYDSSNCEWATVEQQYKNRTDNHFITFQGKTQILSDWARETGIPYRKILDRIKAGVSMERVFSKRSLVNVRSVTAV